MVKRKIINIDESLCDGCALCIPSCPEGTLQIIDGKARLTNQSFCDGLGACMGNCPRGALTISDALSAEYDHEGVVQHLKGHAPEKSDIHILHLKEHIKRIVPNPLQTGGCLSSREMAFGPKKNVDNHTSWSSQLQQWPVQLHLVSPTAAYFRHAKILLVADCVPFAYANFHNDFLQGNAIAIGCPKLDDGQAYIDKVTQIFITANPKSIRVVVMEVPCCSGLVQITKQSASAAKLDIPIEITVIGIRGNIVAQQVIEQY